MIKHLLATVMVVGLMGCGSSTSSLRPSVQHNRNLNREVTRSLEVQECNDKLQACVMEVCNNWQEACDVEPAYCHLSTWLNACVNSCKRKAIACVAK